MVIKYMNYENLRTIPEEIIEDVNITSLHLKRNLLCTLPNTIWKMSFLVELNLNSNFIEDLPSEIASLKNLEDIDLDRNNLMFIPKSIYNLKKLKKLRLFSNKISLIDREVCKLRQLECLNLANNQLLEIPVELCQCVQLKSLHLANNKLKYLPTEVFHLKNLHVLELNHNELVLVPFTLFEMKALQCVDLYDNQLIFLPDNYTNIFFKADIDKAFTPTILSLESIASRLSWYYSINIILDESILHKPKSLKENLLGIISSLYVNDELREYCKKVLPKKIHKQLKPIGCCYSCKSFLFSECFINLQVKENITKIRWQNEAWCYNVVRIYCAGKCSTKVKFL